MTNKIYQEAQQKKPVIAIEQVQEILQAIDELNKRSVADIEWTYRGEGISFNIIDSFRLTGLPTIEFIRMGFFQTPSRVMPNLPGV